MNPSQTNPPPIAPDARYPYGFAMPERAVVKSEQGLTERTVEEISRYKTEPEWMRAFRLNALRIFREKPLPAWGGDMSALNFDEMRYFIRPDERVRTDWNDVPDDIKKTFDRLGIPEAEKKFLAGAGAQYDSEAVYHNLRASLSAQGVIFTDTDTALKTYPDIFKEYFGTLVPPNDNKFAALNSAVWSGGSFLYVPKGVKVDLPLQAYFRINAERFGQFERTLIIADEGSQAHYVEGCTAPTYATHSLHSAVVEIIVKRGARVRYTTIQNWSKNVFNLVTKRAAVYGDGVMEWVDGNLGSALTMKYPSVCLMEEGARGDILSLAVAGKGQHQDAGGKAIHLAQRTSSMIISKSISGGGGRASYRGLVKVLPHARGSRSYVACDALILDEKSRSDTYPTMDIRTSDVNISHEATVGKIGEEQLFYLKSRGLTETDARSLIVNGFLEPIVKELPMEYAVELNRLIRLEMENAIG